MGKTIDGADSVFSDMGADRVLDMDSLADLSRPEEAAVIRYLAVETLEPNPRNFRKLFLGLEEFKADIKERGILTPLMVFKVGTNRYRLIAGERRWRAAKDLGLAKVPCIVKEGTRSDLELVGLIDNIKRKNLSNLETWLAASSYSGEMTQEKIGKLFEVSQSLVSRWTAAARILTELQSLGHFTWEEIDHLASVVPIRAIVGCDGMMKTQDLPEVAAVLREIAEKGLGDIDAVLFVEGVEAKLRGGSSANSKEAVLPSGPADQPGAAATGEVSVEPTQESPTHETGATGLVGEWSVPEEGPVVQPGDPSSGAFDPTDPFGAGDTGMEPGQTPEGTTPAPETETAVDMPPDECTTPFTTPQPSIQALDAAGGVVPSDSGETDDPPGGEDMQPLAGEEPKPITAYDPNDWTEGRVKEFVVKPLSALRDRLASAEHLSLRVTHRKRIDEVLADLDGLIAWMPEGLKALETIAGRLKEQRND